VALAVVPVLVLGAGCRGDDAAPADRQDDSITEQFDNAESILSNIEADLNGD
jgi:hypothetical protein